MKRADQVFFVHLRRPNPGDMRTDPLYELGSFGCTRCHRRNLMNPKRIFEIEGLRAAFAQGGPDGFKLILVTPPVRVLKHSDRCEIRWKPTEKPFRYDAAPLIVNKEGTSDFTHIIHLFSPKGRPTWTEQFSSNFRSRREPLPPKESKYLIRKYERMRTKLGNKAMAKCYSETMSKPPSIIDKDRVRTYRGLLSEAAGRASTKECKPRKRRC